MHPMVHIALVTLVLTVTGGCSNPSGSRPDASTDVGTPDMETDDAGATDGAASAGTLVHHTAWSVVPLEDDPFAERRPDAVVCDDAWQTEVLGGEEAVEISTSSCNYLTLTQSAANAVRAGDQIRVRLWHFELTESDPAEAFAAIRLNGTDVWTETVALPADSGLLEGTVESPVDASIGDPLLFHIDNHGTNTWDLVEVSVQPE